MTIFDPETGDIRNEAYRFDADLDKPLEDNMFPGWPVTINKLDNLGNDANIELPVIKVKGDKRPVVKVYDENEELIFAIRTNGDDFTPKVRKTGTYKIVVGYPESNNWKEFEVTDKSNLTKVSIDTSHIVTQVQPMQPWSLTSMDYSLIMKLAVINDVGELHLPEI